MFKDYEEIRNSPKQTFGEVMPGDIKYKDVNGDGIIDSQDRVAIGATTRPNLIYGFGFSAKWKGLVSMLISKEQVSRLSLSKVQLSLCSKVVMAGEMF